MKRNHQHHVFTPGDLVIIGGCPCRVIQDKGHWLLVRKRGRREGDVSKKAAAFVPMPSQIRSAAAAIRSTWSTKERRRRCAWSIEAGHWRIPIILPSGHPSDRENGDS